MSTNTGRAPRCNNAFAVAPKENGVVITRAPGAIPVASTATINAVVPDDVATACAAPTYAAKAPSNARTHRPATRCPDSSTSITRRFSSSVTWGCAIGTTCCDVVGIMIHLSATNPRQDSAPGGDFLSSRDAGAPRIGGRTLSIIAHGRP